jgi:predicted DCC family thiol-disulfide oxidoreductase YuxK
VGTATFLYDGDCGFCTASARVLRRYVRPDATIVAWQQADLDAFGVTEQACTEAVQWVQPGRPPLAGPYAIAAALLAGRVPWRPLGALLRLRPVAVLAWPVYRWIARNRHRLPGGTAACEMPTTDDTQLPRFTLLNITHSNDVDLTRRQFSAGS